MKANGLDSYLYTSSSTEASHIPNVSDQMEFHRVKECLGAVLEDETQLHLFQLLAGILHLGNVMFQENDSADQVVDVTEDTKEAFNAASRLLGFEAEEFFNCLAKQNMYVNNNIIVKVQNLSQVRNQNLYILLIVILCLSLDFRQETLFGKEYLLSCFLLAD